MSAPSTKSFTDDEIAEVRGRYEKHGQSQVFDYYETLSASEQQSLLSQLSSIKVESISDLLASAQDQHSSDETISAFTGPVGRATTDSALVTKCQSLGMQAIREGKVAALVLAGGQGTRLGFDGPKGLYDIGLPSGRTLFQLMAERILKLTQLASDQTTSTKPIPFYIMTSPLNHQPTKDYFETSKYFGLSKHDVFFFQQGMLPCLTTDGKIILEAKHKVAMAPDGNGGIYPSLQSSGALQDMKNRGIAYLHVFSIDNALVKPADPVFVGYCLEQHADCGNKSVWKSHAHEKVGVVATKGGRPCIVEYSEISKELAEATDDQGILLFGAGNICNHFYTLDFIYDTILPNMGNLYHIAHKKIPYYDETQQTTVTPSSNNGIKLETFIFDVFPWSSRFAVLEVNRDEEFAPVKNKSGSTSDSPDTAREMISALCQSWVKAAGGKVVAKSDETETSSICEIAPSTSYAGEGLEELVKDKEMKVPFRL